MYDGLSFHLFLPTAPLFMLQNDNYIDEILEITLKKSNRHQFVESIPVAVKTVHKHN